MKRIRLTQKKWAKVDDEDFVHLNKWKWRFNSPGDAVRWTLGSHKIRKLIILHREIMSPPVSKVVDHINHDRLDNRKTNLRICSRSENCRNSVKSSLNTSGYKGVYWDDTRKRWRTHIRINKLKRIKLGDFTSKLEAARAYDSAAKKYHGEFAYCNFA